MKDTVATALGLITSSQLHRSTNENHHAHAEDVRMLLSDMTPSETLTVLIGLADIGAVLVDELAHDRRVDAAQILHLIGQSIAASY